MTFYLSNLILQSALLKEPGQRVGEKLGSANARFAEICYQANSIENALFLDSEIDKLWEIIINED